MQPVQAHIPIQWMSLSRLIQAGCDLQHVISAFISSSGSQSEDSYLLHRAHLCYNAHDWVGLLNILQASRGLGTFVSQTQASIPRLKHFDSDAQIAHPCSACCLATGKYSQGRNPRFRHLPCCLQETSSIAGVWLTVEPVSSKVAGCSRQLTELGQACSQ